MVDPAQGVSDLLVAAGIGVFAATVGWGIYISKLPESPDTVVEVISSGGPPSNPAWLLDYPRVQIIIRGAKGSYQNAYVKATEVNDILLGLASQTLNGDRWIAINQSSGLAFMGYDDSNRPLLSLNYLLTIEPLTTAGTNRTAL